MTFEEAYQQIRKHHYEILNERESVSKSARLSLSTWVLYILTECRVADTPQTETQTETQNSNLTFEKADDRCKGCGHYKLTCDLFSEICKYEPIDEPQTDGILFKGNLKEGDYKLIKTTDGWVLEGEDIVYCGWERSSE